MSNKIRVADDTALKLLTGRGFRFKKNLGQNFLFHPLLLEQIADAAGIAAGDTVVEAGAGAGSLTAVLADRGAKVIAIELDRALIPFLQERFKACPDVEIIQGDVMKLDPDAYAPSYKMCANIPYNISTSFVDRAFRQLRGLESGAILLQRETADKVVALPGQEGYGLPALAAAWYGEVKRDISIPPEFFIPRPRVDSALITFRRRSQDAGVDARVLWLVVRGLFNQRRKNLHNGFKSLGALTPANGISWAEALEAAAVDSRRRPETLSLAEFTAILKAAGY